MKIKLTRESGLYCGGYFVAMTICKKIDPGYCYGYCDWFAQPKNFMQNIVSFYVPMKISLNPRTRVCCDEEIIDRGYILIISKVKHW